MRRGGQRVPLHARASTFIENPSSVLIQSLQSKHVLSHEPARRKRCAIPPLHSHPQSSSHDPAFNPASTHPQSNNAEAEYDRLRDLAHQEAGKRSSCLDKAHKAYERGDGAAAHELSEEGKRHGGMMDQYNKQASDYIFRENNAVGRVDGDTIDLHGQFVEEAERILEQRIRYARSEGQDHLHVYVPHSYP